MRANTSSSCLGLPFQLSPGADCIASGRFQFQFQFILLSTNKIISPKAAVVGHHFAYLFSRKKNTFAKKCCATILPFAMQ